MNKQQLKIHLKITDFFAQYYSMYTSVFLYTSEYQKLRHLFFLPVCRKALLHKDIVIQYLACIFFSNDTKGFALNVGTSVSVGDLLF